MSNRGGTIRGHKFHGDPARFEEIADYISDYFGRDIKYIADVAGGQGMLSRFLNKLGYEAEVIDPRGWTLTGVASRPEQYQASVADYYDLIIGLHPDEALKTVVESAKARPVLVVPCCNFWDREQRLGRDALLSEIENYFRKNKILYKKVNFSFKGPNNIGFITGV
jgi:hypothetical protein